MKQPFIKITILYLSLTLMIVFQASSQKYTVNVIRLKNGDVYKGRIIEQPDPGILRIETLCQNIINFNMEDVLTVSVEKFKPFSTALPNKFGPRGYMNITDFGLLVGTAYDSQAAIFSISSFNGYGFSSRFMVGADIGIELFEAIMFPVNIDTRIAITNSKFSPFLSFKGGYSFALEDPESYWGEDFNTKGGYLYGIGVGSLIWVNNRNAFEINLYYRHQDIKTIRTWEWSGETTTITTKYNRLEIRFGFLFQ